MDQDWIAGEGGSDVLRVLSDRALIRPATFAPLHSIEVIDVSRAGDGIAVTLDAHALAQSGNGALEIYGCDKDIFLDTSAVGDAGHVRVETSGRITLADTDGQSVYVDGDGSGRVVGGAGDDAIHGAGHSDSLAGGGGADTIYGGGGRDLIRTGEGSDTVAGGAGGDTFALSAVAGSTTTIVDFDTANPLERLDLRDFTAARSFGGLAISSHNGDAVITAGSSRVVLDGIAPSKLSADDFILNGQSGINVFRIPTGSSESLIQEVIDEAPAGSVVELSAGTYSFGRTLIIGRDDITLRGAGSERTTIVSRIPDSDASATIKVAGRGDGPVIASLAASAHIGDKSLVLTSTTGLKVGDVIHISQANDRAWLDSIGDQEISTDTPPLREMLVRISGISGHTIALAEPAPYAFQAGKASIAELRPIKDVNVAGLRIETRFGTADPDAFSNTLPAWKGVATFEVDNATASTLHDIGIFNSASSAFLFDRDYRIFADHLHAEGSANKGGDGNGYAFHLHTAFANHLSDLSDRDMRHGVLFSSWHAEHYNVVTVASTNRDINFHGSPDAGNVVRIARSVMEYGASSHAWAAVSPGVYPTHPRSTIEANDVTFKYLRSVDRSDIVHADNGGADIATGARDDILYGGDSADRLNGGPGNDLMSGGGGSDRFVRSHGDGIDTIRDFDAGSGGDRIELDDYAFHAFSDIRIVQHDSGAYVDLGEDGGILLKGVKAGALTAANFSLADTEEAGLSDSVATKVYFVGTDGDDVLAMSPTALKSNATIVLGDGHDKIVAAGDGLTLDAATFGHFSGVDELECAGRRQALFDAR